jgi:hypothetical protein
MRLMIMILAIQILSSISLSAQIFPRQCPQDEVSGNCDTCSEIVGVVPPGASFSLTATKCPDTLTSNCMPCCWDVTLEFDPGEGSVWYPNTYLQFGQGDTIITDDGTQIIQRKHNTCSVVDESSTCVTGQVAFYTGFFPNRICLELHCLTCPAPIED